MDKLLHYIRSHGLDFGCSPDYKHSMIYVWNVNEDKEYYIRADIESVRTWLGY